MGTKRWVRGSFTFSTSYATGGETGLTAAALGIDSIEIMQLGTAAEYSLEYVAASGNVLAFYYDYDGAADGAAIQVAAAVNASVAVDGVTFMVWGT